MKKHEYPTIGTVSNGTMREEDLIPDFMDVLAEYDPKTARRLRKDNPDIFAWLEDTDEEAPEYTSEFLNEDLFNALNDIAAPYTYFGSTEGDGCDYGFWPAIDSLEYDTDCDIVLKIDAGEPTPKIIGLFYTVNDHGNVSLYQRFRNGRVNEIWSCV